MDKWKTIALKGHPQKTLRPSMSKALNIHYDNKLQNYHLHPSHPLMTQDSLFTALGKPLGFATCHLK